MVSALTVAEFGVQRQTLKYQNDWRFSIVVRVSDSPSLSHHQQQYVDRNAFYALYTNVSRIRLFL